MSTVQSLKEFHSKQDRLSTVTRNILSSNLTLCTDQRKDYGFEAMWLSQDQSEENNRFAQDVYGISKEPTITTVIQNSPFDRSGIKVGETIRSINGNVWSERAEDRSKLIDELKISQKSPSLRIGISSGDGIQNKEEMEIFGDDICNAYAVLKPDSGTYAHAYDQSIYLESGLLDLLHDDDELAYVVAHEVAHVILDHTGPRKEESLRNKEHRALIEKEADELSIHLMVNAGYDPEGAFSAVRKFDRSNRGPITRLLGLYGAYMPTEERVEFLKTTINKRKK